MNLAPERRLLTRGFAFSWLSHFFHALATNVFVHLPGFLEVLGASELAIGTLFGATSALAIVARPFLAAIVLRMGARRVIVGAGVLHVVLSALYLEVTRLGPFVYSLRMVHGVVEALIVSILFTYAAEVVPASRRTEGIAWFGVSGQLPIALGALLGDYLLARFGYRELFRSTTLFAFLGLLSSAWLGEVGAGARRARSRGVVACATEPRLVPLWFMGVVFATAIAPVFVFLKTFVMHRGVGSVGLFLVLYSLSAALLRVFFGWVPDRVGPKRALVPAMLAVALGMVLIARASTATELGVAGMLAGAGHGLAFPILVGLVLERTAEADRGIAMSLVTSIFDAGQLIGGPLFGAIIDSSGYGAAFGAAAAIAIAGLASFVPWDRRNGAAA